MGMYITPLVLPVVRAAMPVANGCEAYTYTPCNMPNAQNACQVPTSAPAIEIPATMSGTVLITVTGDNLDRVYI